MGRRIIPVGFKPLTFQFSLTCDGKNTRKDSVIIELSSLETALREEFGVWIREFQITPESGRGFVRAPPPLSLYAWIHALRRLVTYSVLPS